MSKGPVSRAIRLDLLLLFDPVVVLIDGQLRDDPIGTNDRLTQPDVIPAGGGIDP